MIGARSERCHIGCPARRYPKGRLCGDGSPYGVPGGCTNNGCAVGVLSIVASYAEAPQGTQQLWVDIQAVLRWKGAIARLRGELSGVS